MSTVLIVEDTPSSLQLMRSFLQDSGYNVIVATDAKEGMIKALECLPDAIVTDVVMPGMSGFELCRQLKRNPITQQVPIIICSSKDQQIDRLWGMRQGANVYLTKPFTKDQLVRAVRSVAG